MNMKDKLQLIPLPELPKEFTYNYIFNNRYNMPKFHHGSLDYEILCTNGFVKLFTLMGRAYWIAQMEQSYLVPDWKFHISVTREQVPQSWDIIAKLFMELQCNCSMKAVFIKDPSNVAKGREITIYIYRYDKRYGEGLEYQKYGEEKQLISLNKESEQSGAHWLNFMKIGEERLKANEIKIQGCAIGDLSLGKHYFSLRNESFVEHDIVLPNGIKQKDHEYPYDLDGWNKSGQKLPFKINNQKNNIKSNVIFIVLAILLYLGVRTVLKMEYFNV